MKEDAFDLYGFATKAEKRSFELLIGVSGVGPKAALSILSSSTPENAGHGHPGRGREGADRGAGHRQEDSPARRLRAARQDGEGDAARFPCPCRAPPCAAGAGGDKLSDAAAALAVLGYGAAEINAALKGVDTGALTTEAIVKAALKNMMK